MPTTRFLAFAASMMAAPLVAHDFWVQPASFWVRPGAAVPLTFFVGHGAARERSAIAVQRVTRFDAIGPRGKTDLSGELPNSGEISASIRFQASGIQVVSLATGNSASNLPAARFEEYAKAEGLINVIKIRTAGGRTNAPGRELYSRRAKTLIQVGAASTASEPHVIKPVGLGLEIVPLRNPYAQGNASQLPVRVLYKGKPLSGALVKLTDLDADAEPVEIHRSDATGRANFRSRRSGNWQFNVVWSEPIAGNRSADFSTIFSSLTFGFPAPREGR